MIITAILEIVKSIGARNVLDTEQGREAAAVTVSVKTQIPGAGTEDEVNHSEVDREGKTMHGPFAIIGDFSK
jgi:hypothetical protein